MLDVAPDPRLLLPTGRNGYVLGRRGDGSGKLGCLSDEEASDSDWPL